VHAAARNENITIIFVNNAIYGIQRPDGAYVASAGDANFSGGRDETLCAFLWVCDASQLDGPEYIARVAANSVKNVLSAKKAIEKAFRNQVEGRIFAG
jgi:2-oxoglutarate ferredoxin oxidoreductase subunit beta